MRRKNNGLVPNEIRVLQLVRDMPGVTTKHLVPVMDMDQASVFRIVGRLAERGLIDATWITPKPGERWHPYRSFTIAADGLKTLRDTGPDDIAAEQFTVSS